MEVRKNDSGSSVVYILPLRNENTDQLGKNVGQRLSLYPTFKEWKLGKRPGPKLNFSSLYPTFKEWKLFKTSLFYLSVIGLYPTFKEWKPFIDAKCRCRLTVCLYPTFKEWKPNNVPNIIVPESLFISYL